MKVFISWAGADREVKNVIAAKFREEGIEYFDSDEFCCSDFSAECIENIRRSSVFVVIVSDASMDPKSYVKNEVVEAHRLEGEGVLNILVYKITENPYSEHFAFNLNHISDANHIARTKRISGSSGIDTLIHRVKTLLQKRLDGTPEKPYDVQAPKLSGVAISQTKYFVAGSRDDILARIEAAFGESNVLILSEVFGFGKKSVIKKYVHNHPEISGVEVQGAHDTLSQFFLADLHFSNINENVFDLPDDRSIILKKFEFLKKLHENDLIVISDIDLNGDEDEFITSLLLELKCRVVFVTQSSAAEYADVFPVIKVGRMENEYLFELFFHYYKRVDDREQELLIPYLERFFEDIGGHTKAVELTAAHLFKDMRATPEEVIAHLSSGSRNNREMKDRILDVFSELLSLERFTDDEKRAMLLIALMASPVIDEITLLSLMEECGLSDRSVLTSLDERRWITYDPRVKTVYMEPIIAQICVKVFPECREDIGQKCLSYFQNLLTSRGHLMASVFELNYFMVRVKNFFNILGFDELSEVVLACRPCGNNPVVDFEEIQRVRNRFLARYEAVCVSEVYEDEEEDADLETQAAQWAYTAFFQILKMLELSPKLLSFTNLDNASAAELQKLLIDEESADLINREFGEEVFSMLLANLDAQSDSDDVDFISAMLCITTFFAFCKKDFTAMQSNIDELLDLVQRFPEILENREFYGIWFSIVKLLYGACIREDAYHTGIAFFEKLLLVDWPDDIKYRMLLLYEDLLLKSDESELALSVVEYAEEIFETAIKDTITDKTEYDNEKTGLDICHAFALVKNDDLDGAIEIYDGIRSRGGNRFSINSLAELIDLIGDRLLSSDFSRALSFVEKNRGLISDYLEKGEISDSLKESFESLLLLHDMHGTGDASGFSAGGMFTDESYYQRYSKEKKNNLFLMMTYNRISAKVKNYDFSNYTQRELARRSWELARRAEGGEGKTSIMPEAFALVSEAGYRVLGYRHHNVQFVGAAAMLDGKIAEILNGEGKTYTIALVAYVNSLYHKKTVVVDASKYLTKRNYDWMKGIYEYLEVDAGYMSSADDRYLLSDVMSTKIVYSDLSSLGFSMLYDERSTGDSHLDFSKFGVIVDEADTVLIESADVPIILSGESSSNLTYAENCLKAYKLASAMAKDKQCYSTNKYGRVSLKREAQPLIEAAFHVDYENLAQANEIKSLEKSVELALYCIFLVKDRDYFVKNERFYRENAATGALYEVSSEMGLYLSFACNLLSSYFLERCLEFRLKITISSNRYLRNLCQKNSICNFTYVYSILSSFGEICGTSATVCSFKKEFKEIYGLDVVAIPTVLPIKRKDHTIGVYVTRKDKNRDILEMICEKNLRNQPILLIVEDINESAEFSQLLRDRGVKHTVLSGLNAESSPEVFANAGTYGSVVIATQIANRGVDIKLGGDAERMTIFKLIEDGIDVSDLGQIVYRLPSDEIKEGELYQKYSALLQKNKAVVSANKKLVLEAGGLCVISTTTYTDMRTEQQIRGRAGRQGEVGESYVYISMEDRILAPIISRMMGKNFFTNLVEEYSIVESPSLKRSVESLKNRVHHRSFSEMKRAAVLSKRVSRSKKEILRLKHGLADGTVTYDDILKIWSQSEENVRSLQAIAEGNENNAAGAVRWLWKNYPQLFSDIDAGNLQGELFRISNRYLSEQASDDRKSEAFKKAIAALISQHLTEMREAEESYRFVDVKNSDKFFEEMYSKSLSEHIPKAIGLWLILLGESDSVR